MIVMEVILFLIVVAGVIIGIKVWRNKVKNEAEIKAIRERFEREKEATERFKEKCIAAGASYKSVEVMFGNWTQLYGEYEFKFEFKPDGYFKTNAFSGALELRGTFTIEGVTDGKPCKIRLNASSKDVEEKTQFGYMSSYKQSSDWAVFKIECSGNNLSLKLEDSNINTLSGFSLIKK